MNVANCFLPFFLYFVNSSFFGIVVVFTKFALRHLNSYRGALNLATATLFDDFIHSHPKIDTIYRVFFLCSVQKNLLTAVIICACDSVCELCRVVWVWSCVIVTKHVYFFFRPINMISVKIGVMLCLQISGFFLREILIAFHAEFSS